MPLPTLGDPAKKFDVILTEPEINAIHGAFGFIKGACRDTPIPISVAFWDHYGPVLEALSNRLAIFDDVETPKNV